MKDSEINSGWMTFEPPAFNDEDYALIIEALAQWAGHPNQLETTREYRAWTLIEYISIIAEQPASDLLASYDEDAEDKQSNPVETED